MFMGLLCPINNNFFEQFFEGINFEFEKRNCKIHNYQLFS